MTEETKNSRKKQIPFLEIFKRAGLIIWQNRFLLWFGFLIALSSPGNFYIGKNNQDFNKQQEKIKNFFEIHWQIAAIFMLIFIAIGIILFLISLVAKAGLVKSVNSISRNKKMNFSKGWHSGKKYLRKLFWLSILFSLTIFVIVVTLAIPVVYLFASQSWVSAVLIGLLAIAIFIPLIFIFVIIKAFAEFYIILSDLQVRNAIEAGYELLIKNFGNSIIFTLLLIAINIVAAFLLLPVATIAILLLIPSGIIFFYLSKIAFAFFLAFAILIFMTVILFVSSVFQTYKTSAWTLFFCEIAKAEKPETEKVTEKIEKPVTASLEKA